MAIESEVYSQSEDSSDWIMHCEGTVRAAETLRADFAGIEQVKERLGEVRSRHTHYENCDRLGLFYSDIFRSVQKIWHVGHAGGEALGQIEIPVEVSNKSDYQIHPAVLDACFQCVIAALPISNRDAYVPIGVEGICLYRPFPTDSEFVWSHILLRPVKGDAVTVTADMQILTEER